MTSIAKEELIERVEQALESIRPHLKLDGGNIRVVDITEENIVQVELLGACGNCPVSYMTMKAGVEQSVKMAVPEVASVVAING